MWTRFSFKTSFKFEYYKNLSGEYQMKNECIIYLYLHRSVSFNPTVQYSSDY